MTAIWLTYDVALNNDIVASIVAIYVLVNMWKFPERLASIKRH